MPSHHNMHLNSSHLKNLESNKKKIEFRVYDEKRKKINVNDTIEFTCQENSNKSVKFRVYYIEKASNFRDLLECIPNYYYEYRSAQEQINELNHLYSSKEVQKYGVIAFYLEGPLDDSME